MDARHLRPALIGGAVMGLALVVARFVIPTATVPEPHDIGCVLPEHRDYARDTFEHCGGGVPFLVHSHTVGTATKRFELYPRGEWKQIAGTEPGDVAIGCIDAEGVRELRVLLDHATWKREPNQTACDAVIAGSDVWQVNGIDRLSYNPCDRTLPDRPTTALVETVDDFEGRVGGTPTDPTCPIDALACYEWNVGSLFPAVKFVVDHAGRWEITKRDVQTEMITLRANGTFSAPEVAALDARIDRAPWTLVAWKHECADYATGTATVTGHHTPLAWNTCSDMHPDPVTQAAVDRLFELYRSALGSQPHI